MEFFVTAKDGGRALLEAKNRVRECVAKGLFEPITVHLESGHYNVSTLLFDQKDSGSEKFPISYVADGEVILNGGINLPPHMFTPVFEEVRKHLHEGAAEHIVYIDLKKLGITPEVLGKMCVIGSHNSGKLYDDATLSPMWCELFVNDTRQTIARYPNDGFLRFAGIIREGEGWRASTHEDIPFDVWQTMRNPMADIYTYEFWEV